jgi:hypothetical protein
MMDKTFSHDLIFSEVYRVAEPEEKRPGYNMQYPPV